MDTSWEEGHMLEHATYTCCHHCDGNAGRYHEHELPCADCRDVRAAGATPLTRSRTAEQSIADLAEAMNHESPSA